jgi:hypothetical protein
MCSTAHAPPALLTTAGTDVFAPASIDHAWPEVGDIATPIRADWQLSFPRAPPVAG